MDLLEQIYRSKTVHDEHGNAYPLRAEVSASEGRFIAQMIGEREEISKSLEVGCAYGLSSLHICSATASRPGRRHVVLDPFQNGKWHGIGLENLKRAGFDFIEFIEEGSEFALPRIAEKESGTFDLVFIDGCHLFEHTMVDLFYANRLLRIGGLIIVDDTSSAPVSKAVNYFAKLPSYRIAGQAERTTKAKAAMKALNIAPNLLLGAVPHALYDRFVSRRVFASMVALEKVGDDKREWRWFVPF